MSKRVLFLRMRLDERVSHRAGKGNAETATRLHRRGGVEAGEKRGASREQGCISPMGATHSKIDEWFAACGRHTAHGLARNEGLKMHDVEKPALHQLRFEQRRLDAQQRFVREKRGSLRHCVQTAREAQAAEMVEEALREAAKTVQVSQRLGVEMQTLEIIDSLFQSRSHEKPPARRHRAHGDLKYGRCIHVPVEIRLCHRQLIQVEEQ